MALEMLTGIGHTITLIVGYAVIGGLIKYIDQAFDIDVFNKKTALFMAIPTSILMALFMALNDSSATIFFALVLGLALTKKIDNLAFQIGLFFLIMIPIFFGDYVKVQWLPFALLFMTCIGDEYTNDWVDNKIKKRMYDEALGLKKEEITLKQKILEMLFEHRILMKLMVAVLVVIGIFKLVYLLSFLAFDFTYKAVEIYSFQLKKYNLNKNLQATNKIPTV